MYQLGNEEKLTLLLSKISITENDIFMAKEILDGGMLDLAKLYEYLVRHKTVNIALKNAEDNSIPIFVSDWRYIFQAYRASNERRNRYIYEMLLPILDRLKQMRVTAIPIKGITLNESIYKDYSLRSSGDFDILVQENDLTKISNVLHEYGFIQSLDKKGVEPASRKMRTFFRMSTHELIPFSLKTSHPECPVLRVDVQFDIFGRSKHTRVNLPMRKLFDTSLEIPVMEEKHVIRILKPEYNLLQLIAHMFRDMTRIQDIIHSSDLRLRQFVDIYEYIHQLNTLIDWEFFVNEIISSEASYIAYYVLYHTEQIFGSIVPPEVMLKLKPKDTTYLNRYGFEEGKSFEWDMPFMERLFNLSRKEEIQKLDQTSLIESRKFLNAIKNL